MKKLARGIFVFICCSLFMMNSIFVSATEMLSSTEGFPPEANELIESMLVENSNIRVADVVEKILGKPVCKYTISSIDEESMEEIKEIVNNFTFKEVEEDNFYFSGKSSDCILQFELSQEDWICIVPIEGTDISYTLSSKGMGLIA